MRLPDIDRLKEEIAHYHQTYRHPGLEELRLSRLYYVIQPECQEVDVDVWPATWPDLDRPGVYAFFNSETGLLYIGKAAHLGRRLNTYFRYGPEKEALPKHDWGEAGPPSCVVTVPVQERFEAPGLEEYLISRLKPPVNKVFSGD